MAVFELGTLMMLINLCKDALRLERWQTARRDAKEKNKLDKFEAELLHAAADRGDGDGLIQLIKVESLPAVLVGGKLYNGTTPYEHAKYLDAFTSLCSRGLIRHGGGTENDGTPSPIFMITGEAFDLDREIHS